MSTAPYKDHPLLPASAPVGQAHVLEVGNFSKGGHKLCDFIATLLHNLTDHPDAIKDFFDPKVKSLKLILRCKAGERGRTLPYIIWRNNKKVAVSTNISALKL
jgi:hypothetical protein